MNKEDIKTSLLITVKKMVPAVFTALVATAIGFIALYTSPVPMIKDFGKMLTIGLIISFFISIFLLLPVLFIRDYFFQTDKIRKVNKLKGSNSSRSGLIIQRLTGQVIKFRWLIILIALLVAVIGIKLDIDAEAETDIETFMPQDRQELKDIHKLRDILGTTDQISIIFESDHLLSEEVINWLDNLTENLLTEFPEVLVETKSITKIIRSLNDGNLPKTEKFEAFLSQIPENQLKLFLNETSRKSLLTAGIKHLETEEIKDFINDLNSYLQEEKLASVNYEITGQAVLDLEMIEGLTSGRYKMTLIGMGLVFLALLAIYRHPIKAFIPLLPIVFIIGWSGLIMNLLNISYTPLTATLGALIIGIGTEFTVLIMERYYEERDKGLDSLEAIKITNSSIGKAILASALTTIGGFSALLVSDFVILNNFGMMTLINISLALLSTFIVMPAILTILDPFISKKVIS